MEAEAAVDAFGLQVAAEQARPLPHSDEPVPAALAWRAFLSRRVGDRELEGRVLECQLNPRRTRAVACGGVRSGVARIPGPGMPGQTGGLGP